MTTGSTMSAPPRATGRARRPRPSSPGSSGSRTPALSPADRTNRAILKRGLEEAIEANRYGQRVMLFTTYAGWHQGFADLADNRAAPDQGRLRELSRPHRAISEAERRRARRSPAEAVRGGFTLPCSVLGNYEKEHLRSDRRGSGQVALLRAVHPDPAGRRRARPNGRRCRREARRMVARRAQPGLRQASRLSTATTYLPKCATVRQRLGPARRPRILCLPGAAGDDHRPARPTRSTRSASPRSARIRRRDGEGGEARPASRAARPSSASCAPIPDISRRPPAELMAGGGARPPRRSTARCRASSRPCRASPTGCARSRPRPRRGRRPLITARARRRAALPAPITSTPRSSTRGRSGSFRR